MESQESSRSLVKHSTESSQEALGPLLLSGNVFKSTTNQDLVVERKVSLFRVGKFFSVRPDSPIDKSCYILDKDCSLKPNTAAGMVAVERGVRPRHTWAITAAFKDVQKVKLFQFLIKWPLSWAPAGYTTYTLGFAEQEEAIHWHQVFSDMLYSLGESTPNTPRTSRQSVLYPPLDTRSVPVAGISPMADRLMGAASDTTGLDTATDDLAAAPAAASYAAVAAASSFATSAVVAPPDSDDEESEVVREKKQSKIDALMDAWSPRRHMNGLAVYVRDNDDAVDGGIGGGEHMVSLVVRGRPNEVLAVLMRSALFNGGIVLDEAVMGEKSKQLIHSTIAATGWAGLLCAPREFYLERLLKKDNRRLYVVLLNSVDVPNLTEAVMGEDGTMHKKSNAPAPILKSHGLFKKPVLAKLQGCYTISPREGHTLESSPDTLINAIAKVDLGGVCGHSAWAKPAVDLFGWTNAFIDHMLMSVVQVRDAVEQSHYVRNPALMREEADTGEEEMCEPDPRLLSRLQSMPKSDPGMKPLPSLALDLNHLPVLQERSEEEVSADVFSFEAMKAMACIDPKYWSELHIPGKAAPFSVRGPTYLKDRKKVGAGRGVFTFAALDIVQTPGGPVSHIARFLPSVRKSGMPFGIIINLIVPGVPMLGFVASFVAEVHPDRLGEPPVNPMAGGHGWTPFDLTLNKFMRGDTATRNKMLKLIPHIADGSWMIKQTVGTTPVLLGKALKTTYHDTARYIEIDIDVSANSVANYATGLVRGATKGLVVDLAFVLEGTAPYELPEALLGCLRINHLDLSLATSIDLATEIPLASAAGAQ